jgi:hypothetical protein
LAVDNVALLIDCYVQQIFRLPAQSSPKIFYKTCTKNTLKKSRFISLRGVDFRTKTVVNVLHLRHSQREISSFEYHYSASPQQSPSQKDRENSIKKKEVVTGLLTYMWNEFRWEDFLDIMTVKEALIVALPHPLLNGHSAEYTLKVTTNRVVLQRIMIE